MGTFDFDKILEMWTEMENGREDERLALINDHLEEKKMLYNKIRELEHISSQLEGSIEISMEKSMNDYWQTEMEAHLEEPTLAQQFEFALAEDF